MAQLKATTINGDLTFNNSSNIDIGGVGSSGKINIGSSGRTLSEGAIAIGYNSDTSTNSGVASIAIGPNATASSVSVTAIGNNARASSYSSIAIGNNAAATGTENTTGVLFTGRAIAIGTGATASGDCSIAIGPSAAASGSGSIAIGRQLTQRGTNGNIENISTTASGSNSIAIGPGANASDSSGIAIGISASTLSGTNIGCGVIDPMTVLSSYLCLGANGTMCAYKADMGTGWNTTSDLRDKTDFKNIDSSLEFINALNPVTYVSNDRRLYINEEKEFNETDYKLGTKKGNRRRSGFKAQEVYESMKNIYNDDNYAAIVDYSKHDDDNIEEDKYYMCYEALIPFLVGAVKELTEEVNALKKKLEEKK